MLHLVTALLLWPAIQFREGYYVLPLFGLLFACYAGLRSRSPVGWRVAVHSEGLLALVLTGGAVALAWFIARGEARRFVEASGEFAFLVLLAVLLGLGLLSVSTLLFLLRRETRAFFGMHAG